MAGALPLRPHRTPLSVDAIQLLIGLPKFEGTDLAFPGQSRLKPLSDMSLTLAMRRNLMSEWTALVNTAPAKGGNVVKFKSAVLTVSYKALS
jgi:hypothetical protein